MAAVRQQVLNWLYSVLTSEYKDVNRTYNDVAQTLSHYSSLSPKTDVYTFENGASALLLQLSGTLPVNFRGTTYRFPITLWVQHGYPQEAPLVYVTPTETMAIRPGQHVDPQGKLYHPYLVGWAEYWDKSNILDFLAILRDVFAKEPPVISRQQQNAPPRTQPVQPPPPVPPPPPGRGVARSSSVVSNGSVHTQAPPPPPKPTANPTYSPSSSLKQDSGPPLPPLPMQNTHDRLRYGPPIPGRPSHTPQRSSSLRYESAPPLPPQPSLQQARRESHSPVSPITPPEDQYRRPSYNQTYQPPSQQYKQAQYTPAHIQQVSSPQAQPQMPPSYVQQPPYSNQQPPARQQQPPLYPPQQAQQSQTQPYKAPPPPDLIDAPLTLPIPTAASTNLPAPPVPPNPEKDMLLHNIGLALQSQRQHTRTQTTSSLPGLSAQHAAMLQSLQAMQQEISSLSALKETLNSNTSILHASLADADHLIQSVSQTATAPSIDELLVAPTVVGNQLYELVSEERALGDALFVLGRAVERGRVSAGVFAKMTRGLAREWFLKKALVKKIGRGMGLNSGAY